MSVLEQAIAAILALHPIRTVALTGAGISAESGLPTFRGNDGLWQNFRAEDLATPEAFARDPEMVWRWYESRRDLARAAVPNTAHLALAEGGVAVVTQNVDGLHERAGSKDVVELHGNLFRVRCTREGTVRAAADRFETLPPHCECGALLRPDVVWFGEMLPPAAFNRATHQVTQADLLLIVGTSGLVYPAAGLVSLHSGLSIEVNPEPREDARAATYTIRAKATETVPPLIAAIERRDL